MSALPLTTHADRMKAWDRVRQLQDRLDGVRQAQRAVADAPALSADRVLDETAADLSREIRVLLRALRPMPDGGSL